MGKSQYIWYIKVSYNIFKLIDFIVKGWLSKGNCVSQIWEIKFRFLGINFVQIAHEGAYFVDE